jgi:branched-chain amino acid transport system substrate-binding protein
MNTWLKTVFAATLAIGAGSTAAQQTVNMPIVIELSGAGAVSGTNFRDGAVLAIEEINAKGGILGRRINAPQSDTQSNPGISRAQVQKAIDGDPYVILGPVFSGSVKVNMILCQQAEVPQIVGAEAADITQAGNPYIFRTSFGQQMSMPKIANYIRDGLQAKTVAVLWVNNDFGKGGRDTFVKEMAARNIKVVVDVSTESGQVDFAADVVKLKGQRRRDLRLHQRGGKRALPARGAQAGRHEAAHRRDHAARAEGDRHGRPGGQRRTRARGPFSRRAGASRAGVQGEIQQAFRLRARP